MKKFFRLSLGFVCLFTLFNFNTVHVHAEDDLNIETTSIVPYGRVCSCGGTYYLASTNYGAWYNSSEVKCNSHTYGTDIIQKRAVTKTYKCGGCGKGYSTTSHEQKRVCHGYDK